MHGHLLPAVFAVALWWGSTSLILRLDRLHSGTFRRTMLGATALLVLGFAGLCWSARSSSVAAVYVAFTSAILVWAWIEIAFLTGTITGPRRTACPADARGWARLRAAIAVILWHEATILGASALVAAITLGAPNPLGGIAFLLLAAMRLSAKLNLYLGARNFGEAMLPDHLRYLESYFARRRMNALFPFSVLAGLAACGAFVSAAIAPDADLATAAGQTLLASLVALGLAEHAFMVLPVPPESLYRWAMPARSDAIDAASRVIKPHGSRP